MTLLASLEAFWGQSFSRRIGLVLVLSFWGILAIGSYAEYCQDWYLPAMGLIAVVLSVLFTRWVAEPLNSVLPMLREIGKGSLSFQELRQLGGELGEVARALETADRRVHQTMVELREEIVARHEAEIALSAFKTTLDLTLDCVFMFEADTLRFSYVNEGATRQVGYSEQELYQMSPVDIKPEFDEARFRSMAEPLIHSDEHYIHFETIHQHKDGHGIPVEIFLQYIETAEISPRFIAIVRDISSKKAAEQEIRHYQANLEQMVDIRTNELVTEKDKAEAASNAKTEFLSRMSHELRTPMNAVLGFAQLLETDPDEHLSARQQENTREILDAGQHLLTLINEVLDLARIDSGRMEIMLDQVNLAEVVQASIKLVQIQADSGSIQIISTIDGCGDAVVHADFTRLRQILVNLLDNAIKYNRAGGSVTVSCRVAGDALLYLDVTDTGRGIRDDELGKLFVPFERLDANQNVEGTGIGLTICVRLAEMMGGALSVQSTYGEGSIFSIELPLYERCRSEEIER